MDDLIVGPLHESGVDRHYGSQSLGRKACGKSHGVLFGDADVEVAIRRGFGETDETGPLTHRRCHHHDARVLRRKLAQPLAEDLGVGGRRGFRRRQAKLRIEGRDAVVLDRLRLGAGVALAFNGSYVQEFRTRTITHHAQFAQQCVHVVSVDGAAIREPQSVEKTVNIADGIAPAPRQIPR